MESLGGGDGRPRGKWPIMVTAKGFQSREIEVTIEAGKATIATVVLEPE